MRIILVLTAFAFLVQAAPSVKNINKKAGIMKEKDDLVVDLLLYIDYTEYAKWLVFKGGNETEAVKEMTNFYYYAAKKINEMYQNMNQPGFTLSINIAEFVINKKFSIFADVSENYTMGEPVKTHAGKAMIKGEEFYAQNQKTNPAKRNKFDVAAYVGHMDMAGAAGATELDVACSDSPVLVAQSYFSNEFIDTLAHEIAHTLGANHDDLQVKGCTQADMYLMTPGGMTREHHVVKNSFLFSQCSKEGIAKFINGLNKKGKNCLKKKTKTPLLPVDVKAPGEMYSLDQQCQLQYGSQSYHCGGGDVCKELLCFIPDKQTCITLGIRTAADGSPCANKSWCQFVECVYDPQAPALNQTSDADHCHMGDFKGQADGTFNDKGESLCDKVRNRPKMCYMATNRDKCCETCNNLETSDESCRFGNREDWCESAVRSHPAFCKLKSSVRDCCLSCHIHYKEQDIGAYDAVKTDTCYDVPFDCEFEAASLCYMEFYDRACCGSCSVVENAKNKGCEYGDKKEACTEDMCATEADQCCHTCKKDQ